MKSLWLGLIGAGLAGLAFVVPVTELAGRTLTAWELLRLDQELLTRIDSTPGMLREPPPEAPPLGPLPPVMDNLRAKGDEMRQKARLVHRILEYIQIGLFVLLAAIALAIVAAAIRAAAPLVGLAGVALTGTLVVLAIYLRGVNLPDQPLPILAGYWLATAGMTCLAMAGLASLTSENWKWSLPVQVVPALAWVGYLSWLIL